jgi:PPM family protein phosphatase
MTSNLREAAINNIITTEIIHASCLDAVLGQHEVRLTPNALLPTFRFDCGQASHVGLKRTNNQDSFCAEPKLGLWLVADGMGGHAHGALASALARDCIIGEINYGRGLSHAIALANREIARFAARQNETARTDAIRNGTRSMGTTVVALRVFAANFELAWVGDSRCYLAVGNELKQLSCDHSLVQELLAAGILSPEQAKTSRYRNVVTQALGVTSAAELQIDCVRGTLLPGMQFLLCSDGLTEHVSDVEIGQILRSQVLAQAVAEQLIAAALAGGGSDNVTAIVLNLL